MPCSAGAKLIENLTATTNERVLAEAALSTGPNSFEEKERRFLRADDEWWDAIKGIVQHRKECSICKTKPTDDLQLCAEGERLAEDYFAITRDVLRKSEAAPNHSHIQGRVNAALDSLLRHKRGCDTCR